MSALCDNVKNHFCNLYSYKSCAILKNNGSARTVRKIIRESERCTMEEKIMIKGKFARNKIAITLLAVAAAVLVGTIAVGIKGYSQFSSVREGISMTSYLTTWSLNGGNWFGVGYLIALIFAALAGFYWFKLGRCQITVSDKRVWGKTDFGRQVDLPINQISALSYGKFGSVCVATSSGVIRFWYLTNKEQVYTAISNLLGSLQQKTAQPAPTAGGTPDELKKYKELLDSGVISQAEFDAKKRQLLGL